MALSQLRKPHQKKTPNGILQWSSRQEDYLGYFVSRDQYYAAQHSFIHLLITALPEPKWEVWSMSSQSSQTPRSWWLGQKRATFPKPGKWDPCMKLFKARKKDFHCIVGRILKISPKIPNHTLVGAAMKGFCRYIWSSNSIDRGYRDNLGGPDPIR